MHLSKFLHTKSGKYIMSVILGFGLATFFRAVCKGKNCIIKYAPKSEDVDGKTYKFDNKCYNYSKSAQKCNSAMETVSG